MDLLMSPNSKHTKLNSKHTKLTPKTKTNSNMAVVN